MSTYRADMVSSGVSFCRWVEGPSDPIDGILGKERGLEPRLGGVSRASRRGGSVTGPCW